MPPLAEESSTNAQQSVSPTPPVSYQKKILFRIAYFCGGTIVLLFVLLGGFIWYREQPKVLADQLLCSGLIHAQLRAEPHGEGGTFYPFDLTYIENGQNKLIEEIEGVKIMYANDLLQNEGRSYWPTDVVVESTAVEIPNRDSAGTRFVNIFVDPSTFPHEAYESIASCLKNEAAHINNIFIQGDMILKQTRLGGITYSSFDEYFKNKQIISTNQATSAETAPLPADEVVLARLPDSAPDIYVTGVASTTVNANWSGTIVFPPAMMEAGKVRSIEIHWGDETSVSGGVGETLSNYKNSNKVTIAHTYLEAGTYKIKILINGKAPLVSEELFFLNPVISIKQ